MDTPGELTSMPGQPPSDHLPAPNKMVAGLLTAMVVAQTCPEAKPRASMVPPVDGKSAIAALILAQGSDCGKFPGLATPLLFCAVRVVKFPVLGATLPIGGGDPR